MIISLHFIVENFALLGIGIRDQLVLNEIEEQGFGSAMGREAGRDSCVCVGGGGGGGVRRERRVVK